MADDDDEVAVDKADELARRNRTLSIIVKDSSDDEGNQIFVLFEFRPLLGVDCIFHRRLVEREGTQYFLQLSIARLSQTYPCEGVGVVACSIHSLKGGDLGGPSS